MKKIFSILNKYEEIFRYLIIGLLTTIVSLFVYYICVFTFLDPKVALELQIANIISWICSVVFAYIANRIFVFKSKNKKILREVIAFTNSRILTLILDMALMHFLVIVFGFNDKICKIIVQVLIIILNYVFSKFLVFKK